MIDKCCEGWCTAGLVHVSIVITTTAAAAVIVVVLVRIMS